jgi:hypothetical protein
MPEVDAKLRRAVHNELEGWRLSGGPPPAFRRSEPIRSGSYRSRTRRFGFALAVCAAVLVTVFGVSQRGGNQDSVVRHLGNWSLSVSDAQAALKSDTIDSNAAEASALAEYKSLAVPYAQQGIFLGSDPTATTVDAVASATEVTFPDGSRLTVPNGPADIWIAQVGPTDDPTNAAEQVNMVIGQDGTVLKAVPTERPGLVGDQSQKFTAAQLAGFDWTTVVAVAIKNAACSGSACPPDTSTYTGGGAVSIATADTSDGGVIINVTGQNLKPDTAYNVITGAGVAGIGRADGNGNLAVISTLSADQRHQAETGSEARGGVFRVEPQGGPESFYACPLAGRFDTSTTSCS